MHYAIIDSGVVRNIVLADASFAQSQGWIAAPDAVAIGWVFDGEEFSPPPPVVRDPQEIQAEIVEATQQRLDEFARSRGYAGILSACTYATSPTPRFASEGQYCVEARDATWAKLYEMLDEVLAGTRPMPASFADVEPELPALMWPT